MTVFFCRRCLEIRHLEHRYDGWAVECQNGHRMVQIINGEFPPSDAEVFLAGLQKGFALASSGPSATLWKYLKWLAGALGRVPWVFAFRGALGLLRSEEHTSELQSLS